MALTKDVVTQALKGIPGPVTGSDLAGAVRHIAACDNYATVKLRLPAETSPEALDQAAAAAHRAVLAKAGHVVDSFMVEFVDDGDKVLRRAKFGKTSPPTPAPTQGHTPIGGLRQQPSPQGSAGPLPGVRHVVAVGAGKGGVGKSTIALNLAVGLARKGHAVGLLDGDIYGPSMPTMLGLESHQTVVHEGMLQPFYVHGIKVMTIGKLVEPDKPLIWRGPMAHGAFKQLTEQTNWGELDYLIIDLPPGTGDVSLTMAQLLKLTGAVVVCTPQKVAQDDASRAAGMFQQLQIEVLGVVENMSVFIGDDGKAYDIFGKGGAERMAARMNLPFLGAVPITMALRANSDQGDPTANFEGKDRAGLELSRALMGLVTAIEGQVAMASIKQGQTKPTLSIS